MLAEFGDMFAPRMADLPSVTGFILILLTMAMLGLAVSVTYMLTDQNKTPTQSFALTLALLPSIVTIIIMMVGSNFASALSLGGAFAIIRFRSVPGNPKDITFILFCMAIGLTGGMGFMLYAIAVAGTLCSVMLLLHFVRFAAPKRTRKQIKITIPEDFNYHNAFDDILKRYATNVVRKRVRLTDLGSLYEVTFAITMVDSTDEKKMLDEIREKNGNLPIVLVLEPQASES
jgi:hypothetical protein